MTDNLADNHRLISRDRLALFAPPLTQHDLLSEDESLTLAVVIARERSANVEQIKLAMAVHAQKIASQTFFFFC